LSTVITGLPSLSKSKWYGQANGTRSSGSQSQARRSTATNRLRSRPTASGAPGCSSTQVERTREVKNRSWKAPIGLPSASSTSKPSPGSSRVRSLTVNATWLFVSSVWKVSCSLRENRLCSA
jgi:hypothetical protein